MIIKNIIPSDVVKLLTHHLLRLKEEDSTLSILNSDPLCPKSAAVSSINESILDTINEIVWPTIEQSTGELLLPTYAYARVYTNGDELPLHTDRPSCEVSVTIQLGRSHHYAWPIFVGEERFDLAEGDGVLYNGEDYHWRNVCDGPKNYYTAQIFLHYVRKNGSYSDYVGDKRWKNKMPFKQGRSVLMESK